ncbi:MAG: hypothetical protein H7Z15_02110 [Rhizobacter sp.]|nr:hypothetical protein [Rhizobacter sp.]
MTTTTQDAAAPQTEEEKRKAEAERKAAYKEAAVELGKGIALGLVPFLGQAIDVYDTIESSLSLYNAKKDDDKENAQFDLILAIVGWVPGPGDGVKKSLRLVNKNPDRFAPVLFDLLRFVLQECGIHTSPEALLEEIFNAGKLKAQLKDIKEGIEDSSVFQNLPEDAQHAVKSTMSVAMASLPMMVLVVEKRIKKWVKKQPNSSAHVGTTGRAKVAQPGSQHAGNEGRKRPASGGAGDAVRSQAATQALTELTNEIVGISGEHIADYMCAYGSAFGWGKDWSAHDAGGKGRWNEGTPGKTKQGKLSAGGKPKEPHVLYKLADGANGTGIDAVWRANRNNGGKPYAIVEAKASRNEDAPKFNRKPKTPAGMLGVVVKGEIPITDLVQVIEPLEDEGGANDKKPGGKPDGKPGSGSTGRKPQRAKPVNDSGNAGKNDALPVAMVQMSHEWIAANSGKAISQADVLKDFKRLLKGAYSRHLFYAPRYHPSGSPDTHFTAKQNGQPDAEHAMHDAFHYDDRKVKEAVNKRKAALRKKHGNLPSLKEER